MSSWHPLTTIASTKMWCWIFLLVSVPILLVKSQANEMFKGGLTSEGILISVPYSIRLTKWLFNKLAIQIFLPNHILLHFVAVFHVASLSSTGVENKRVGVDNKKALELTNSTVFHRGREWKSSRAGQQNNFFIFPPNFNVEISPKNATKHSVALWIC